MKQIVAHDGSSIDLDSYDETSDLSENVVSKRVTKIKVDDGEKSKEDTEKEQKISELNYMLNQLSLNSKLSHKKTTKKYKRLDNRNTVTRKAITANPQDNPII